MFVGCSIADGRFISRRLQLILLQPESMGLHAVPLASLEVDGMGLIERRPSPMDGVADGRQPSDPLDLPHPAAQRNVGILVVNNPRLHLHQVAFGKGRLGQRVSLFSCPASSEVGEVPHSPLPGRKPRGRSPPQPIPGLPHVLRGWGLGVFPKGTGSRRDPPQSSGGQARSPFTHRG